MKFHFIIISMIFMRYSSSMSVVPVLTLEKEPTHSNASYKEPLKFLPFIMLIEEDKDTSEYWRETEILSLVRNNEADIDYEKCEQSSPQISLVHFPSRRTVRPVCRSLNDYQLCPQCPRLSNNTECELFRDSCRERKVRPVEYSTYCDRKYGKWRSMFISADYMQCRCCDECVFYRELDQSCVRDEYMFDSEEFLPVTSIDFRAGCNPYWGHPEQERKALRCDKLLRRCETYINTIHCDNECGVPVTVPALPNETLRLRRNFRFQPPIGLDCPVSCRGYDCQSGLVKESQCAPGAFLPEKDECNCCGRCSAYQQLNEKCAEYKKTVHIVNGTEETEIEEEFLEPGCDDGLVCRQGYCQDIHSVHSYAGGRRKRDETLEKENEPCKREMKYFKKKYGVDGHLHFEAPQCTPLWLYAPVQCRRFVCYCALEDGTFIEGIKVPRVEVSNMNCEMNVPAKILPRIIKQDLRLGACCRYIGHALNLSVQLQGMNEQSADERLKNIVVTDENCAREKCRTGSDIECDGYGNYKEAIFTMLAEEWAVPGEVETNVSSTTPAVSQPIGNGDFLPTTLKH